MRASYSASTIASLQSLEAVQMSSMSEETKALLEQLFNRARQECASQQSSSFLKAMQTHLEEWNIKWLQEQIDKGQSYALSVEEIFAASKNRLLEEMNEEVSYQIDDAEQRAIHGSQDKLLKSNHLHQKEEEKTHLEQRIKEQSYQRALKKKEKQAKKSAIKSEEILELQRKRNEAQKKVQITIKLLRQLHDYTFPKHEAIFYQDQKKLAFWQKKVDQFHKQIEEQKMKAEKCQKMIFYLIKSSSSQCQISSQKSNQKQKVKSKFLEIKENQMMKKSPLCGRKFISSSDSELQTDQTKKQLIPSQQNKNISKRIQNIRVLWNKTRVQLNQVSEESHSNGQTIKQEVQHKKNQLIEQMETYEQQIHDLQGKLEYQSNKI